MTGSSGLASGTRSYTYDQDGNRLTKTEAGVTFTTTYDRTDQQVSVIKTGGSTQTFTSDAYGNLTGNAETAAAVTTMAYDLADKLTGIDAAGTANDATFTFDALGRFKTRVLSGSTDTYSYAGTSETVERISNSSGPTITDSIVSPAGDRLGIKQGTTVNWLLPDPHGNVGAALDATEATVVHAIRYDAYGQTLGTGSAGGTAVGAANWKYQGRLDVSPSGLATPLYDMSARFYSPGLGTFTQLDSVMGGAQNPLSMNRFLYALANPSTLTDPSGHKACGPDGIYCTGTNTDIISTGSGNTVVGGCGPDGLDCDNGVPDKTGGGGSTGGGGPSGGTASTTTIPPIQAAPNEQDNNLVDLSSIGPVATEAELDGMTIAQLQIYLLTHSAGCDNLGGLFASSCQDALYAMCAITNRLGSNNDCHDYSHATDPAIGLGIDAGLAVLAIGLGAAAPAFWNWYKNNPNAPQFAPTIATYTARGRQFESDVLAALREAGNKASFMSSAGNGFIPDSIKNGILEIKDVAKITATDQLRGEFELAKNLKQPFDLIVSGNNVSISQTVQDMVKVTGGTIVRFDPASGFFLPWP